MPSSSWAGSHSEKRGPLKTCCMGTNQGQHGIYMDHFHWLIAALRTAYQLDFPTSEAGDALAGWSLCSSSWLSWDRRRRRKVAHFHVCHSFLSVCLVFWLSSQSVVGSRDKRTPASPSPWQTSGSLTPATAAVTARGWEVCPCSQGPVFPFVPQLGRGRDHGGRSSRYLEAVASISRTCRLVHHSLRSSPLFSICLFPLYVLTLKGAGNLGGCYIPDSLITTHIVNRLKHCFISFDISTYWPKKMVMY